MKLWTIRGCVVRVTGISRINSHQMDSGLILGFCTVEIYLLLHIVQNSAFAIKQCTAKDKTVKYSYHVGNLWGSWFLYGIKAKKQVFAISPPSFDKQNNASFSTNTVCFSRSNVYRKLLLISLSSFHPYNTYKYLYTMFYFLPPSNSNVLKDFL